MLKRIFSKTTRILLLIEILTLVNFQPTREDPTFKIVYVDDDNVAGPWDGSLEHPYLNITSALQHASARDILHVRAGTYCENVIVNETLTLLGENREKTIVDGRSAGNVIEVKASNVTITGFTIKNSGEWPHSGLALFNVKNCNITENEITNNNYGIRSEYSSNNSLTANSIINNWIGLALYFSLDNNILGNNITANNGYGIFLHRSLNNSIIGNDVRANAKCGIELDFSSDYNRIIRNNITAHRGDGIGFDHSSNNIIFGNRISANTEYSMRIYGTSKYNRIYGNDIRENCDGMRLSGSSNGNKIFHNNFVNNQQHASTYESNENSWDNDYPSGGNYWSDYVGADLNGDGIGNETYRIDAYNIDRYPLAGAFSSFDVGIWNSASCSIDIISNSTVSEFQLNNSLKTIIFKIKSSNHTISFCRVTIPTVIVQKLWQYNYTLLVNEQTVEFKNWTDWESTYIYFTHEQMEYRVTIVPEMSPSIILPLLIALTTLVVLIIALALAVTFKKRKTAKN